MEKGRVPAQRVENGRVPAQHVEKGKGPGTVWVRQDGAFSGWGSWPMTRRLLDLPGIEAFGWNLLVPKDKKVGITRSAESASGLRSV